MKTTKKERILFLTWLVLLAWIYLSFLFAKYFLITVLPKDIASIISHLFTYLPIIVICVLYRKELKAYYNFRPKALISVFLGLIFIILISIMITHKDITILMVLTDCIGLFIIGFFEESFFRGMLYPTLKEIRGKNMALFISTILFVAAHVYVFAVQQIDFNIWYICILAFISIIFVYLFEKTNCLWVPIFAHCFYNINEVLAVSTLILLLIYYKTKEYRQRELNHSKQEDSSQYKAEN